MGFRTTWKNFWTLKPWFVSMLAVLVPLFLVISDDAKRSKCAYVIIVMAILWLTEALPIPVTALLPIFMFPMLQVADARKISASYITDTSMLFLGGLMLAVAVEEWNLHRRVAISVMRLIGAHPSMLMLGLMLPTWFLSMWISNTAATSMMIPIIQAVVHTLEEVHEHAYGNRGTQNPAYLIDEEISENDVNFAITVHGQKPPKKTPSVSMLTSGTKPAKNGTPDGSTPSLSNATESSLSIISGDKGSSNGTVSSTATSSRPILDTQKSQVSTASSQATILHRDSLSTSTAEIQRLAKALALSVAFAANVGGIATLTGTPPNLVLKGMADELYANKSGNPGMESPITFANWMGFAFPLSFLCLVIAWFWLMLYFLRGKCFQKQDEEAKEAVNNVIRRQFKELGFITFAEAMILIVFIILVILWLFREPPNMTGWGASFFDSKTNSKYVTDSTPVVLLSVSLFLLPARIPEIFCMAEDRDSPRYTPILTWYQVEKRVSWGVIVLLGGGFAIAKASKDSGLSDWLGNELKVFADNEPWVMNLIFTFIITAATGVTSNTAMATLLMPILSSVGLTTGIHPLFLMITATVACSLAFMLPVATPPNAIVFSTGYLKITDMVFTGVPMSVFSVLLLTLAINTWGKAMYSLDDIPEYFKSNVTVS